MWNILSLMCVSLVAGSYQRVTVFTSKDYSGGDPGGALWPSASVVDADHRWRRNIGETEGPAVFEPAGEKNNNCLPCTCGTLGKKVGIIGGNATYVDEYPWMALLLINDTFCGGSLINDRYVMTAAHCVKGEKEENIIVRLLEYDRSTTNESRSKEYKVLKVIVHEKFVTPEKGDDIALLRLATKVIFSWRSRIRPVCLPKKGKSYVGYHGVVIGWGQTSNNGPFSNVLQQVDVPIISNKKCNKMYGPLATIRDGMLCDGFRDGGKDSCHGDSGGPLHVVRNDEFYHVVGIVSWGTLRCANSEFPGVNTRVSKYLKWLDYYTQDACSCDNHAPSKNHE